MVLLCHSEVSFADFCFVVSVTYGTETVSLQIHINELLTLYTDFPNKAIKQRIVQVFREDLLTHSLDTYCTSLNLNA